MINEITKQITKAPISDYYYDLFINNEKRSKFRNYSINFFKNTENEVLKEKWLKIKYMQQTWFWNNEFHFMIPIQRTFPFYDEKSDFKAPLMPFSFFQNKNVVFPEETNLEIRKSKKGSKKHWIAVKEGSFCIETGQFANWRDEDSILLPVKWMIFDDFREKIANGEIKLLGHEYYSFVCKILTDERKGILNDSSIEESLIKFNVDLNELKSKIEKEIIDHCYIEKMEKEYITNVLECDKIRAELDAYEMKVLEDINKGHWELWEDDVNQTDQSKFTLKNKLTARNPKADIHHDGLIGIDFGTKSTIVSKQDGNESIKLVRVGTGSFTQQTDFSHYENPTILEFIDLSEFLKNYNSKEGRPKTRFSDLKVSYPANQDLKECGEKNNFYSFFYDIKQWCAEKNRSLRITDQNGFELIIPAFTELKETDFDPLELYAYYLGLYINNMYSGIFLDYILSFPVAYEKEVKLKVVESFKKGLRKSLPESVVKDNELMKEYRVRQGVSEPAAYAITALEQYKLDPMAGEKIMYAIFDFGGGTTDFDFGIWRAANNTREEERYDYVIEHFGSESDRFLGGENLLELMAYIIFSKNSVLLNSEENNIFSFTKPDECESFEGSERIISFSQEAKRNTKQLIEKLRPFWEEMIGIDNENDKEKNSDSEIYHGGYIFKKTDELFSLLTEHKVKIDLYNTSGALNKDLDLYLTNFEYGIDIDLIKILEERIERGVKLFFDTLENVYEGKTDTDDPENEVNIFLAGNSSKSPVLRKIFDKYIEKENTTYRQEKEYLHDYYHLYPALGTAEARIIQQELGVDIDNEDEVFSVINGKTGVAYGLIAGRESGNIKVISEIKENQQVKFRYNIGINKRNRFLLKFDRNKIGYGKWVYLINADVEDFELYYTSLPYSSDLKITDQGVYKKKCRITCPDSEKKVFIRTNDKTPDILEYCVSSDDIPSDDTEILSVRLSEGKG